MERGQYPIPNKNMLTTRTYQERHPEPLQRAGTVCQLIQSPNRIDLNRATDQAVAACGGDARNAVKALIVAK